MGEHIKLWLTRVRNLPTRHFLAFRLIGATIVFLMLFMVAWGRLDPDFGWHLTTGKYILGHGIPRHDFYTFTAKGHNWVDHEWGNDVILALLYQLGGYILPALFFSALWAAGILLIGWRSRITVLFLGTLAILPYAGIRPIAWSVFLFALSLRIINSRNRLYLWLLPLLFILWANLHAGFIAGLALIAYFAVIKRNRQLAVVFVISTAATLINAYGLSLYGEIGRTLFDPAIHNQINEWRSLYITTPTLPYVLIWFFGFAAYAKIKWRRWIELGPLLFLTGLSASRNFPFFIVVTIADIELYWHQIFKTLPERRIALQRVIYTLSIVLTLAIVFYATYVAYLPYENRQAAYPVQAVAYLQEHRCQGNVFNSYNYGGYLIWKLPQQPVYIDGRMVTWIKHMDNYERIVNDPQKEFQAQFIKYNIKCALIQNSSSQLISTLIKHNWITKIQANGSTLLLSPTDRKNFL